MVDFHTHILPAIDDGSKCMDDSNNLLADLESQGIYDVVLTPHFYPDQISADEFISKRDNAIAMLKSNNKLSNKMRLYAGAEVYCNEYLLLANDLTPFCIEGTSLMLLELPFSSKWPNEIWRLIDKLISKHSITPIIAHAERYPAVMKNHPADVLSKLIDQGCIIQCNCSSFLNPEISSKVLRLLDIGLINILGSDCHDVLSRPPLFKRACAVIVSELGKETLEKLNNNATRLISGKPLRSRNLFF